MTGPRIVAAAILAALALAAADARSASPSPYDMTYRLRGKAAVPLYADMSEKAARKGMLPADARGIVLRWCRSEIPFGSWQFGSRRDQFRILDSRWCEISYGGLVGDVPGAALSPE